MCLAENNSYLLSLIICTFWWKGTWICSANV